MTLFYMLTDWLCISIKISEVHKYLNDQSVKMSSCQRHYFSGTIEDAGWEKALESRGQFGLLAEGPQWVTSPASPPGVSPVPKASTKIRDDALLAGHFCALPQTTLLLQNLLWYWICDQKTNGFFDLQSTSASLWWTVYSFRHRPVPTSRLSPVLKQS